MVEACAERDIELCLFTGPRGTWDIGAATRTDSGGGGLRARGHDAVAGCVEDAVRATALGVKCLLVADEGVLWTLHRLRARGRAARRHHLQGVGAGRPGQPGLVRGVRAARRRLHQHPLRPDARAAHRDPPGQPRPRWTSTSRPPTTSAAIVRIYDAAELIRRGAPIYLKFGLSKAPASTRTAPSCATWPVDTARERVRRGRLALDLLARLGADGGHVPAGLAAAGRAPAIPPPRASRRDTDRATAHPHCAAERTCITMRTPEPHASPPRDGRGLARSPHRSTACGQEAQRRQPTRPEGKGGTVGIAMPTKSSERWIADGNNMVKAVQGPGYKTDLQYGDDDVENQVAQIENMITKGARLLVIAAIDGSALTDVLQQAADADIPVISYDRLIRGTENVDYYATFDNFKVGVLQGGYIVDKLGLQGRQGPVQHRAVRRLARRQQRHVLLQRRDERAQAVHRQRASWSSGAARPSSTRSPRCAGTAARAQARMDNLLSKAYTTERRRRGAVPVRRHLHRHHLGAQERRLRHAGQAAADRHRPGRRARLGEVDHRRRADPDRLQGHPRAGQGGRADGRRAC